MDKADSPVMTFTAAGSVPLSTFVLLVRLLILMGGTLLGVAVWAQPPAGSQPGQQPGNQAGNVPANNVPPHNVPPAGFTALFNGKDLTGWRGGGTKDHRWLLGLPEAQRAAQLKAWTSDMNAHWKAENGELLNDGKGAYATTEKEYGDFELWVDYNMAPKGDSGIYLRNVPQVQIWDPTNEAEFKNGAQKGSGGLWNNAPGAPGKDPLVLADKPAGVWNHLRVLMVGTRVSVWLNEQQTVDRAVLENYYDRKMPIPARGPLCLQTHGAPIKWRNVFLREIGAEEATKILAGTAP